MLHKKHRH